MNKIQFLTELEKRLEGLPEADIKTSLDFYSEMIDDCTEDGLSEEEAISQIGQPQEIAKQILINTPILRLVKENIKSKHRMRAWEIVLLALGSPIWLSLAIAAAAVVISVYVSLWAVVIALWACGAAFIGSALGGVASAVIFLASGQNAYAAFTMLAAAFFLAGFSILFFFACKESSMGMMWLTKRITLLIKSLFLRKERA